MSNDEPVDDRCNGKTSDGGYCANYPAKDDDGEIINGRCRNHGGVENIGAPKGNSNAERHGMLSDNSLLYDRQPDWAKGIIDDWKADLRSDIEKERGRVPSYREPRIHRFAMNLYKATILTERWQAGEGGTPDADVEHPMVERHFSDIAGGGEMPPQAVYELSDSTVEKQAVKLMRENDSWLSKVLGLDSPPGDASPAEELGKSLAAVVEEAGKSAGPVGIDEPDGE